MRVFHFVRGALRLCVAVAMLAGCGGHAGDGVVPNIAAPNSLPNHKTFNYTGGAQNFKVPAGVTQLRVIALGAHVRPEHEQLRIPIGNDLEDQTPEMRLAPSVGIRFEHYLVTARPSDARNGPLPNGWSFQEECVRSVLTNA